MLEIECFKVFPDAAPIVPARRERDWMDLKSAHFAYRCIPLTAANSTGWEILSPCSFSAVWDGGSEPDSVQIAATDGFENFGKYFQAHFGVGTFTFTTGYLFRTSPGWAIWVRGVPNWPKDGIIPLEGIVETDWLPYTFTMNWRFTRPGIVRFEKGDPMCFVTPHQFEPMKNVAPVIKSLDEAPEFKEEFRQWGIKRQFVLKNNGPVSREIADQKKSVSNKYLKGETMTGQSAPDWHLGKRKMKKPVDRYLSFLKKQQEEANKP